MDIKLIKFNWNEQYPIFASEQYLHSISDEYGWLCGFKNKRMQFVLPFVIKKKLIFRYLEFQTSTLYMDNSLTVQEERTFLNEVVNYFRKNSSIDFIKQPSTSVVFNIVPDQSIYAPFGSYVIDLTLSEEELWNKVHSKHRNVIRRAEKDQVHIVRDKTYAMLAYDMIYKTMARSNMSFYSRDYYKDILSGLNKNIEVFIAFKDNVPQGCAVIPYSSHCAYYLLGGSVEHPSLGAMNLLHWEAMKYFKAMGVCLYDFVGARIIPPKGSKLEGIQRFKNRFGSTMKQGYLWKAPIRNWKYYLFRILLQIKKKTKTVDVIEQEGLSNKIYLSENKK